MAVRASESAAAAGACGNGRWGKNGAPAEAQGIAIRTDGKAAANLPCSDAPSGKGFDDGFMRRLGLHASDTADAFEIPEAFFPK